VAVDLEFGDEGAQFGLVVGERVVVQALATPPRSRAPISDHQQSTAPARITGDWVWESFRAGTGKGITGEARRRTCGAVRAIGSRAREGIREQGELELPLGGMHLAVLIGADANVPRRRYGDCRLHM
jgi:hypothetical protein